MPKKPSRTTIKLHLSPMICKARETELGRPSRKRFPSEARLVLRPAFAGWRPAPGPSRYFTSRALTPLHAMGAGDQRMTVAAATHVNQRQGSRLAFGKPAVAELHQRDEARIEIEPHLGQSIFLALRGAGRGLTEDGELRQLLQPICKCRPRDAERRTESLERLRPEECFADDQEGPRVGNDIERAGDRTVPSRVGDRVGLARSTASVPVWPVASLFEPWRWRASNVSLRSPRRAGRFESCARLTHHRN